MAKLKEVYFDGFTDGFVTIGPNAFPDTAVKITFPEGLNDNDVRKKMTLTVFPASAKLFSGTEPLPHDYVYVPDGSVHYQKCDACGHVKEDSSEAHAPQGDFITGKPGYNYREYHYQECKCGMEMGFLHEWNDGAEEVEDVKTYTCIVCGATKTETIEHDYVLTPDGTGERHCLKCSDCGKIKPDSYEDHAAEGEFITDNPNYNYQKYHYQKCKCGLVMGIIHSSDNGTVTLEPTYDTEGKTEYRCTVCGYVIKTEVIPALGGGSGTPSEPPKPSEPTKPAIPDKPVIPSIPESGMPFIKNENEKNGWGAIKAEAENTAEGGTVTVDMNGTTVVPGYVIDIITGKDVTLVFDMGSDISWSVNGKSVTVENVVDIDFSVKKNTNAIPIDVVNKLTGERYSIQISLAHNGEFGFTAVMSINLGIENSGLCAALYFYNNGGLELIDESEIAQDGAARLTFRHASNYLIVIGEKTDNSDETDEPKQPEPNDKITTSSKPNKDDTEDSNPETGEAGQSWKIMLIGSVAAIVGAFSLKRKKYKAK